MVNAPMKPIPVKVYSGPMPNGGNEIKIAHRLIIFVALCAILIFGRDILIPVVLSILLSVLLSPLIRGAQRLGVPKAVSVIISVILTVLVLASTTFMVGRTLTNLAADLPAYENNLRDKARSLRLMAGGNAALDRAAGVLEDLQAELESTPTVGPKSSPKKPIPVEVRDTSLGPLTPVLSVVSMIAHPISQVGIMILMLAFILFNREDLRDRLIRLAGTSDIHRTTVALDEAGSRLSRLFIGQLAINVSTGAIIAVSLFLIGVPGALLWGLLTAMLRFLPFVGTLLSSILPIVIALAVGDGWYLPFTTAGIIIAAEITAGHILEPIFLGRMTGVSSTAIVIAAAFWASIWGPVGLILSTPITVGLMVIGRHIDSLHFLHVLFGTEPVLERDHAFYHRILTGDAVEAAESAHRYLADGRLSAFLDEVAIPGLLMAKHDLERGILPKQGATDVATTFSETLEEVWDEVEDVHDSERVLLVANHGPLNVAATVAFSAFLRLKGIPHRVLPPDTISPGRIDGLDSEAVAVVCLCSLSAPTPAQLGYIGRRLNNHLPDARVINVSWTGSADRNDLQSPAHVASMLPVDAKAVKGPEPAA